MASDPVGTFASTVLQQEQGEMQKRHLAVQSGAQAVQMARENRRMNMDLINARINGMQATANMWGQYAKVQLDRARILTDEKRSMAQIEQMRHGMRIQDAEMELRQEKLGVEAEVAKNDLLVKVLRAIHTNRYEAAMGDKFRADALQGILTFFRTVTVDDTAFLAETADKLAEFEQQRDNAFGVLHGGDTGLKSFAMDGAKGYNWGAELTNVIHGQRTPELDSMTASSHVGDTSAAYSMFLDAERANRAGPDGAPADIGAVPDNRRMELAGDSAQYSYLAQHARGALAIMERNNPAKALELRRAFNEANEKMLADPLGSWDEVRSTMLDIGSHANYSNDSGFHIMNSGSSEKNRGSNRKMLETAASTYGHNMATSFSPLDEWARLRSQRQSTMDRRAGMQAYIANLAEQSESMINNMPQRFNGLTSVAFSGVPGLGRQEMVLEALNELNGGELFGDLEAVAIEGEGAQPEPVDRASGDSGPPPALPEYNGPLSRSAQPAAPQSLADFMGLDQAGAQRLSDESLADLWANGPQATPAPAPVQQQGQGRPSEQIPGFVAEHYGGRGNFMVEAEARAREAWKDQARWQGRNLDQPGLPPTKTDADFYQEYPPGSDKLHGLVDSTAADMHKEYQDYYIEGVMDAEEFRNLLPNPEDRLDLKSALKVLMKERGSRSFEDALGIITQADLATVDGLREKDVRLIEKLRETIRKAQQGG